MSRETLAATSTTPTPGCYGKVLARGDFIARCLPRTFLDPWDNWLQQALFHSRQQLGAQWLECYLSSPLWRFVLSPGACGKMAFAGLMMPSVDRVGRYFPLSIAAPLNGCRGLLSVTTAAQDWFERAEQLILEGLDDHLDIEDFTARVQQLGLPPCADPPNGTDDSLPAWHCLLDSPAQLQTIPAALAGHLLAQHVPHYSLWWSSGSERIAPCLLICQGLPPVAGFAALLDGDWGRWGWGERPLCTTPNPPPARKSHHE